MNRNDTSQQQQQKLHHQHHHHQHKQHSEENGTAVNDNDNVFDSILNATDRRMSWQQQRSHKSFKPSLSVICK